MIDHLPKPLDPHQLIEALNRWLVAPAGGAADVPNPSQAAPPVAQALPDIPGFDLQAGLACLGGKAALLQSMLGRFGETYATVTARLQALVDAQNYRETRRMAHTLKGAAATLGATRISQAAGRAEEATRLLAEAAGEQIAALRAQVTIALTELDSALQPALPVLRTLRHEDSAVDSSLSAVIGARTPCRRPCLRNMRRCASCLRRTATLHARRLGRCAKNSVPKTATGAQPARQWMRWTSGRRSRIWTRVIQTMRESFPETAAPWIPV